MFPPVTATGLLYCALEEGWLYVNVTFVIRLGQELQPCCYENPMMTQALFIILLIVHTQHCFLCITLY